MQVQKVENNNFNPQFGGILKIKNYKKGGKVVERLTDDVFDKSLYETARKNLFGGDWSNIGSKEIPSSKFSEYTDLIKRTFGINLPKTTDEVVSVDVKNLGEGYRVKIGDDYKITHVL